MVWRLKSLISSSLMRAQMPSPKSVPLGTTTAALPGLGGRRSLRMMSWRKSSAVSEVCLSSGKLPRMATLLFTAEGRIGHDDIHSVSVANLSQRKAQAVQWIDLGRFQAVQNQVHLSQ